MIWRKKHMFMYTKKDKEVQPIDRSSLLSLAHNLRRFIYYYRTNIVMTEKRKQILDELEKYAMVLENERYGLVINDTSVIFDDVSNGEWLRNGKQIDISLLNDEDLPF
jgi:hypothetical protein